MSENRGYPGRRLAVLESPATFGLLAANALVYVVQFYLLPTRHLRFWFEDTFALSLYGLQTGHIWQLLTYQFMHAGFWHIFLNSWAIFVFGRPVEDTLGWARMLGLYFLSGVVGGLLQVTGVLLLPSLFDHGSVVGASAGAFGLVAAFAALYPRQKLFMLLFFVIPIAMKARTLLVFFVVLSLLGILYPVWQPMLQEHTSRTPRVDEIIESLFANIGHAAHLGGMCVGFGCAFVLKRRSPEPPPFA